MSYSDDTAAFMFNEYATHGHDWRATEATDMGWVVACHCGKTRVFSDNQLEQTGEVKGISPPVKQGTTSLNERRTDA